MKKLVLAMVSFVVLLSGCATQKEFVIPTQKEVASKGNTLDFGLSILTNQIVGNVMEHKKRKIAVVEFSDLQGNITEFGKYLSEELITRLFKTKGFEVIERKLLNKILSEQKLSLTGVIEPVSAQKVGKILGVDAIVSGTITDLGGSVKVNARIISTEEGLLFGVAAAEITKDATVKELMSKVSARQEIEKEGKTETIKKESQQIGNFLFEVKKCKKSGKNIIVYFTVTKNKGEKRRYFKIDFPSLIVKGDKYTIWDLTFGSDRSYADAYAWGGSASQEIPPQLPVNGTIIFKDVESKADRASLDVRIYYYDDEMNEEHETTLTFYNFPILKE